MLTANGERVAASGGILALQFHGYYGQSLPAFQRKVYHAERDVLADVN